MVFLCSRFGDHSNRLFQTTHFEAFCKYNNVPFLNMDFTDMDKIYGIAKKYIWQYISISRNLWPRREAKVKIIRATAKFANFISSGKIKIIDYADPAVSEDEKKKYDTYLSDKKLYVFVFGWRINFEKYVNMYKDFFVQKYTPKITFSDECKNILSKFDGYDLTVAVHIRRGDYKRFYGGKYYYEDGVYEKFINDFASIHKDKKILFVLFSNSRVGINISYDNIISKCKWYEDQAIMSKCNYIIGAPSTFSMWASFIGDTPYYHIYDKNDALQMSKFTLKINPVV